MSTLQLYPNTNFWSITWHGLCLLPAGVSVVMAKDCDRGLPGDAKCFMCLYSAVKEGGQAAFSTAFHQPRKDLLLPPEWFRTCQELETQETRSVARSPLSLFHGNERQVALITLETNHLLLLKTNPTLAVPASPPPRSPTPSTPAWVSG